MPKPKAEANIIDLLATDKSQYFAQSRPIIVLSFNHRVCFFKGISSGNEEICHFYARAITRRKVWFYLRMQPKKLDDIVHEQTVVCRSCGGLLAIEKEKNCNE